MVGKQASKLASKLGRQKKTEAGVWLHGIVTCQTISCFPITIVNQKFSQKYFGFYSILPTSTL
jgi:hypothetical protein